MSIDAEERSERDCPGCDRRGCGREQPLCPRTRCRMTPRSRCVCTRHLDKHKLLRRTRDINRLCRGLRQRRCPRPARADGRAPRPAPRSPDLWSGPATPAPCGVTVGMRVAWVSSRGTGLARAAVTVSIFIPVLETRSLPTSRGTRLTMWPSPRPLSPRESVRTLWKGNSDG